MENTQTPATPAESSAQETPPQQEPSLEQKITTLQDQLKQEQNKYLYLYAEFDTYKKRVFKERADLLKFGHENFARELLLSKDNLERALNHSDNNDAFIAGIRLVSEDLSRTLEKYGIITIKTVGEKFDPTLHEAAGQEEVKSTDQDGIITQEHQKGYVIHGRLLRPARVIVGYIKK